MALSRKTKKNKIPGRKRIFLVDDEPSLRMLARVTWEVDEYDIQEFGDGLSAWDAIYKNPPDLVVLDWMMPGMSGLEVFQVMKLVPNTRNVPVIFLTSKGQERDKEQARALGVRHYLVKPFSPLELISGIEDIFDPNPVVQQEQPYDLEKPQDSPSKERNEVATDDLLISAFTHDLRNHLGLAQVVARDLLQSIPANDAKAQQCRLLLERLQAAIRLVGSLLYSYKLIPQEKRGLLSFGEMLGQALQSVLIPEGVTFQTDVAEDMPAVRAQPGELAVIISNLLQNSLDALKGNGTIVCKTRGIHREGNLYVQITVSDDGPGISPDTLASVFKDRISEKTTGLGLGLWLTNAIIQRLGGKLSLTNISPHGVEATVLLPAVKETA